MKSILSVILFISLFLPSCKPSTPSEAMTQAQDTLRQPLLDTILEDELKAIRRNFHNYYLFGGVSPTTNLQNSMETAMEFDAKNQVRAEIIVRIMNPEEHTHAMQEFLKEVQGFFTLLQFSPPLGLEESIMQESIFNTQAGIFSIYTQRYESDYFSWKFTLDHK